MGDSVTEAFEESRPRLRAVAYRMLGSGAEADDAVQEAWIRLNRSDAASIENLGGWLTTVVSRVCLDMLRSRRTRREVPAWELPDAGGLPAAGTVATGEGDAPAADREALLADSLGPALMVVLDTLSPPERLAFVLHDLFGVPFEEIAPIVGRTPVAARQLASRARRRVQGAGTGALADGGSATGRHPRQRAVVDAFLAASRHGDFEGLLALLDPDVVLRADPVAVGAATRNAARGAPPLRDRVVGAEAVARTFVGRAAGAEPATVGGLAAAVWAPGGRPRVVFAFVTRQGRITEIEVVADPKRIAALDISL